MDPVFFFIFAIILVALAVSLSYLGITGKASFPPDAQALKRMTLGFAVIVAITAALAVNNASREKNDRNEELAEAAAKEAESGQAEEGAAAPAPGGETTEPAGDGPATGGAATELDLSSPADGSLVFMPAVLEGPAGTITLKYSNPSPVPHSIAIEDGAKTLDQSEIFTEGEGSASSRLKPGEYVFYCTVPSHRESGMEGKLTVK